MFELPFARRLAFTLVLLFAAFIVPPQASAVRLPSQIRLLDGGRDGSDYLAALEIKLDPGYMTYWRTPGEAGLPPVFDWSGSKNVAEVAVSWPAPSRIDEAGSIVYGFHDGVTLPLRIRLKQAGAPATLKLNLEYGVCREQCIPAQSSADIELNGTGTGAFAVQQAMAALPKPVKLGNATQPFAIIATRAGENRLSFTVLVRAPAGSPVQLFAEGPEAWTLATSDANPGASPGNVEFKITVEAAPTDQHGKVPVRLTARTEKEAIETMISPP